MSGEQSFRLTTADGVELRALLATPPGKPAAALVLCHGLTTDCHEHGAFPALRESALAAGLAVARFDFRGHGQSGGSNESLRLAGVRADADAVAEMVSEQLGPELPLIPVGVSFGGAAAVHLADSRRPCAALALWYAVIDYQWEYGPDSPVPFIRQMRAAADPERDPPWSEMPVIGTGWYLPRALLAEVAQDRTLATLERLTVPVLSYHGSRDQLVDVTPLRRLAQTHSNVDLRVAHGAGHGFLLWQPWVVRRTVRWAADAAAALTP